MSTPSVVKFNTAQQPEFFPELRKRVNQHFKDKKISQNANLAMKIKTAFMIGLYFIPYLLMVTGVVTNVAAIFAMWALMGLGMSGIGLAIMHDANHGSYSKNKYVNNALGFLLNFTGGYHINWKIQHNVLHHSFTNVHEFDEDIDKGIMRFSPNQPAKGAYRFQAFYAPFLYGLMTIYWFVAKDFQQLLRYQEKNLLEGQGLTLRKAMFLIVFHKIWYAALFIALPLMTIALPVWQILTGFFMMHFICGLLLALIFQPAHVIEETEFFVADDNGSVENNWAIHQMKTTANFANGSTAFSWFIGGLNYQIEHHLFPNICHVHYKEISVIVKKTAEEFNVPYYHHRTFFDALKSHFTLLNELGTGAYDKKRKMVAA
jgi:linoleoyl-CoA desaturase